MKISPETKIAEMLAMNEGLADSLIMIAPEFERFLARGNRSDATGQVSIRQAAQIAQFPVTEVLYVLNLAAGETTDSISDELKSLPSRDFKYPKFSVERDENLRLAPEFSQPLELLVFWHTRLTEELQAMSNAAKEILTVGETERKNLIFEIGLARNYFATAHAKHQQDEERSLFPRLRRLGISIGIEFLLELDKLESGEREAAKLEKALNRAIDRLTNATSFAEADAVSVSALADDLLNFYEPHFRFENETIFPKAAETLSAEDIDEIGMEMVERRMNDLDDDQSMSLNPMA